MDNNDDSGINNKRKLVDISPDKRQSVEPDRKKQRVNDDDDDDNRIHDDDHNEPLHDNQNVLNTQSNEPLHDNQDGARRDIHFRNDEDEDEDVDVEESVYFESQLKETVSYWTNYIEANPEKELVEEVYQILHATIKQKICPEFKELVQSHILRNANSSWIFNNEFGEKESAKYPATVKLSIGQLAKCLKTRYNCTYGVALHALLNGSTAMMGPTEIAKSVSFSIAANLYLGVVGDLATAKSHVVNAIISYCRKNINEDLFILKEDQWWTDGMTKYITCTAGSFSEFCREFEKASGRKWTNFDEIGIFDKLWSAFEGNSEAMSVLLTCFHGAPIRRTFNDKKYQCDINHPYLVVFLIAQPELFTNIMSKHLANGGVSRFLLTTANYEPTQVSRHYFSSSPLTLANFVELDVVNQGLFKAISRRCFFRTLLEVNVDKVRITYGPVVDATLTALELLVKFICIRLLNSSFILPFVCQLNTCAAAQPQPSRSDDVSDGMRYLKGLIMKNVDVLDRVTSVIGVAEHFLSQLMLNGQFEIDELSLKIAKTSPKAPEFIINNETVALAAMECIIESLETNCVLFDVEMTPFKFECNPLSLPRRRKEQKLPQNGRDKEEIDDDNDEDKEEDQEEEEEERLLIVEESSDPVIRFIVNTPGPVINLSGVAATAGKHDEWRNLLALGPQQDGVGKKITGKRKGLGVIAVWERLKIAKEVTSRDLAGAFQCVVKRNSAANKGDGVINIDELEPELKVAFATFGISPTKWFANYNKPSLIRYKAINVTNQKILKTENRDQWIAEWGALEQKLVSGYDDQNERLNALEVPDHFSQFKRSFETVDDSVKILTALESKYAESIQNVPSYITDPSCKTLRGHYENDLAAIIELGQDIEEKSKIAKQKEDELTQSVNIGDNILNKPKMPKDYLLQNINADDFKGIDWFGMGRTTEAELTRKTKLFKNEQIPAEWKKSYGQSSRRSKY